MRFPINLQYCKGIPINSHPGAFGCRRKFNFHEGIDLYGKEGHIVYAIKPGIVVANRPFTGPKTGYDWWLDTDAVLVKSDTEYYCYGELKSDLRPGQTVGMGTILGELVPVLPPEKIRSDIPEHSNVMVHLEKYDLEKYHPDMGWSSWEEFGKKPDYLLDPTIDLINILKKNYQKVNLLI